MICYLEANIKHNNFTLDDFRDCGKTISLNRARAEGIVHETPAIIANRHEYAGIAAVPQPIAKHIQHTPAWNLVSTYKASQTSFIFE